MSKFQQQYLDKKTTAEGIAAQIKSNWVIVTDLGITIPYAMMDAIGKRAEIGELTKRYIPIWICFPCLATMSG